MFVSHFCFSGLEFDEAPLALFWVAHFDQFRVFCSMFIVFDDYWQVWRRVERLNVSLKTLDRLFC